MKRALMGFTPHLPPTPALFLWLGPRLLSHCHADPSPKVSDAPRNASSTQRFSERCRNQKLWVLKHNFNKLAFALVNE